MARISTYIKDTGLTDKDLLVGSNYVSGGAGAEIYETTNFTLKNVREYVSSNIVGSNDGISYITENVQLNGSTATKIKICSFPSGTTIIDGTFNASEITTLNLPDNLVTIQDSAFSGNYLTSVTLPDTVTSIGADAFNGNRSLTTINIPSGVTNIGDSAFFFTDLTFTDLAIPASCAVGPDAFRVSEVTGTLTIGDSAALSRQSFASTTLNNIVIGDNVSGTNRNGLPGPFEGAIINGAVTIGNNIDFGNMAWFKITSGNATSVSFGSNFLNYDFLFYDAIFTTYTFSGSPANTIPDGFTLSASMFQESGITSVTIGDNVTINQRAFSTCRNIASLTLGNNVTMVDHPTNRGYQFSGIASNISGGIPVTIPGTTTLAGYSFHFANISTLTIQSGLTEIPEACFNAATITSLSIPSTVLTFGDFCFANSTLPGLTTLTLGSSGNPVTVGGRAFDDAVDLTTVNLPTGSTYNTATSFPVGATINFY